MNWDTAPQELDALRAQVAALTKEVELARFGNAVKYGTSHPEMYKSELDVCKGQLAAAQAHTAQLREALKKIAEVCNGYDLEAGWACRHAREALAKVKP